MTDDKPREIWQSVDHESYPRRWVEAVAYDKLEQKIKDLEKEIADTATISYMISAERSRDVIDKYKADYETVCESNLKWSDLVNKQKYEINQYKEQCEILVSYIREEYEDYYRHIDKHDIPVTKEYTRCIGNLSKALTAYQEFKDGL